MSYYFYYFDIYCVDTLKINMKIEEVVPIAVEKLIYDLCTCS